MPPYPRRGACLSSDVLVAAQQYMLLLAMVCPATCTIQNTPASISGTTSLPLAPAVSMPALF